VKRYARLAIVGAGYMGGGIAQTLAQSGIHCTLLDAVDGAAESRRDQIVSSAPQLVADGFLDAEAAERLTSHLHASDDFDAVLAESDFVFEVVFERIDVKHDVLARIEKATGPDTVIATNTSAIPIGELATVLERPERFLGVHWFNPAPLLPGIEIIPHATTDHSVIPGIIDMLRAAGKEPAVVSDTPGFVCNRLQFALFREAARMVEDGHAEPAEIDKIVRASFGFRLALYGPFAVADMAGLDVYANSYVSLEAALGDRFTVPPSLKERVDAGDLGIKTGGGYLGLSDEEATQLVHDRDRAYLQLGKLRTQLSGETTT
jgi:3-hydroxybutyryl-CoA dehydrogenase